MEKKYYGCGSARTMRSAPFFCTLLALLTAVCSACTSFSFSAIRAGLSEHGHYIEGVPFYTHRANECGPAAVATVVAYWGFPVSVDQISSRIYESRLQGTLPLDIESFLQERGFETGSFTGAFEDIKKQVGRDIPVISLLDQGIGPYRRPHYVTVIGFDDKNRVVIAHDGSAENNVISYERFMNDWARAGNWMLIAVPGAEISGRRQ